MNNPVRHWLFVFNYFIYLPRHEVRNCCGWINVNFSYICALVIVCCPHRPTRLLCAIFNLWSVLNGTKRDCYHYTSLNVYADTNVKACKCTTHAHTQLRGHSFSLSLSHIYTSIHSKDFTNNRYKLLLCNWYTKTHTCIHMYACM